VIELHHATKGVRVAAIGPGNPSLFATTVEIPADTRDAS
jgi:hypothetical protein